MIMINLAKCEFSKGRVTYLGYQVGCRAVLPRMAKVQAIVDFPVPQAITQLMHLLDMCGIFHHFMPNLVTVPLTNL